MKIQLNTDDHIDGTEALAAQVGATVDILKYQREELSRDEYALMKSEITKTWLHAKPACLLWTGQNLFTTKPRRF